MYYTPKDRKQLYILDEAKLAQYLLSKKMMDFFETFILEERSQQTFENYAEKHHISIRDINGFTRYKLNNPHAKQRTAVENVNACVKNSDNEPYIPGSSLKGAIRTALLVHLISHIPSSEKRQWIETIDNLIKKENANARRIRNIRMSIEEDLEKTLLHTLKIPKVKQGDALNSVMRGIAISDSAPIHPDNLIVATKNDYNSQGQSKGRGISLFREALKPGTKITTHMTLDTHLLSQSNLSFEDIRTSINTFARLQQKVFYNKFRLTTASQSGPRDFVIYLGGGVGFVNKTFLYALDEKKGKEWTDIILSSQFPGWRDKRTGKVKGKYVVKSNVAPYMRKMTTLPRPGYKEGNLYDMGKCRINIE